MSGTVKELLIKLEQEMKQQGCWQQVPPAAEKLNSVEPFSVDTLTCTEWLQWVYVARLHAIIEAGGCLPSGAQVYPYAEEALKSEGFEADRLLALIKRLDDCLA
ncbi:YqcC family protein [Reinekea marinisedimentorum]|uniref:Uncharacterized protein YqcC (DUF446 family) n=1 Tax=Reinekea marinisedimentorum TaxID=230495 RepID=A0A4R3I3J7_9GAMM|nr:YqcC family protein [Reinekea marinisedimentorum]TCS40144.1 uncharacterized protein YqcC (DUF446 family) [Reinekea marinisedimentorum]